MKKTLSILICLLMCLSLCASAETTMGEGYSVQENALTVRLWQGADDGCEWFLDVDDESLIALQSERTDAPDGDSRMHTWVFAPKSDGEALITFSYGDPGAPHESLRTLCYTAVIEGGLLTDVEREDLSWESEASGDDSAVAPYDGDTGGVALSVPEGMVETETDDGQLLTSDDGARTILIDYQPDDNPEELFEQLKDAATAARVYEDEESGARVVTSTVDLTGDPPSATLVLSSPEGYTVYTGYQAPDGGVLHVHTTYALGEGME